MLLEEVRDVTDVTDVGVRRSILRWSVPLDAYLSFQFPVALLVLVPVLAVLDVPPWMLGTVLIAAAMILGGCGVIMAVGLARTMVRGEDEHPEIARFLGPPSGAAPR